VAFFIFGCTINVIMSKSNSFALAILLLTIFALHRAGCTIIDIRPEPSSISLEPINSNADPFQETYKEETETPIIKKIGGRQTLIIPKADYRIAGRVVSKRHYYMDWSSKLSPVDLAIAWGPMASTQFDKYVSYSHSDRYYSYRYSGDFPEDPSVIAKHSANEHLIPANTHIEKTLKSIKVDEIVEIEGFLVNVDGDNGRDGTMSLQTSLTRDDTGAGACEIIYVTKVRIKDGVYK
jgi:hypothetical protein